eukprot:GFYU01003195.1.p1 GENE.GFYU01003195.1~~GFYU01003195.1.p1  ORF type:complete len:469 (+),score=87.35 GFYU01003195.1:171-1577(+)
MKLFQVTIPPENMSKVLTYVAEDAGLKNVSVVPASNCYMLTFRVPDNRTQEVLAGLGERGVGVRYGLVDVMSINASVPVMDEENVDMKDSFWDGASQRPNSVQQLYSQIQADAKCTFDYIALIVVSSLMAGIGFATNDGVHVVASMLLSPLMGPILASALGATIRDRKMFIVGLRTEAIGLLVCVLVGMLLGFLFGGWGHRLLWPTQEMRSRGLFSNLLFGVLVAIGSGAGVAIAVTQGGINSLVGVAIAASLLPPAVNAGMMLVYGVVGPFLWSVDAPDQAIEIAIGSLALVAVNVFFIFIICIGIFKMKGITMFKRKVKTQWADLALPTELDGLLQGGDIADMANLKKQLRRQQSTSALNPSMTKQLDSLAKSNPNATAQRISKEDIVKSGPMPTLARPTRLKSSPDLTLGHGADEIEMQDTSAAQAALLRHDRQKSNSITTKKIDFRAGESPVVSRKAFGGFWKG